MHYWFGIALGGVALVGSAVALVLLVLAVSNAGVTSIAGAVVLLLSVGMYAFGILSGVEAFRCAPTWHRPARVFWFAQVPMLLSPIASWALYCGPAIWIYVHQSSSRFGLGATVSFGAGQELLLFGGPQYLVLGVNIVALVVAVVLHRIASKPDPGGSPSAF